jgi:hypothetical protein
VLYAENEHDFVKVTVVLCAATPTPSPFHFDICRGDVTQHAGRPLHVLTSRIHGVAAVQILYQSCNSHALEMRSDNQELPKFKEVLRSAIW